MSKFGTLIHSSKGKNRDVETQVNAQPYITPVNASHMMVHIGHETNRVFHKRTEMPILAFSSLLHENKTI